jgi:hypothetical protein
MAVLSLKPEKWFHGFSLGVRLFPVRLPPVRGSAGLHKNYFWLEVNRKLAARSYLTKFKIMIRMNYLANLLLFLAVFGGPSSFI